MRANGTVPNLQQSRRSCRSSILLLALATLLQSHCPEIVSAKTIEQVTFAPAVTIGEKRIPLRNAALLRYLKFIKAYVAAFYLPPDVPAERVLDDLPKRLEISYLVSIAGPDFGKGAAPVLRRNLAPEALARLQPRIDRINAAYQDVKPGDRYAITYLPGRGTELSLNGTPLITIEGADFAAAYFGIWLGREPIDDKLKQDLLRSSP